MIVIDASAVLAIYLEEPEAVAFLAHIRGAGGGLMSAVNYWEVLSRAFAHGADDGRRSAKRLIELLRISVVATTEASAEDATDAFEQWGRYKGGPLNLGDCFAYALAKSEGDGLLCKGDDFRQTDVKLALR